MTNEAFAFIVIAIAGIAFVLGILAQALEADRNNVRRHVTGAR